LAERRIVWRCYGSPVRLVYPDEGLGWHLRKDLRGVSRRNGLCPSALKQADESALQVKVQIEIRFIEQENRRPLQSLNVE
jgi:hypothetical protein